MAPHVPFVAALTCCTRDVKHRCVWSAMQARPSCCMVPVGGCLHAKP